MDVRQFDFLAAQPSAALKPRETFCGISKRALALLLVNVVFWQPIWAQADGIVVSSGGGNTRLDQAGNGVPIVNIATPGANGLSHNQFQDYNVDSRGVILNNVTDRTGNTQLGGIIVGNPNLKGAAAGVILNEVVGGSPSQLKGYTEVAGQSARVIVANPYGVTCNGCGFINTPRVTLTTGKPVLDGNRLDHFQVDGGSVSIEGNGLNADNVDQFDIVTRSAKINAELHARQLNVIAGRNDVAADSLATTPRAASPGDAPQLAIDSSALGGMYANTIRLVGTETGVGVKLAGNLAASAGDIQLDANGQLTVAQTAASGNIALKGQGIDAQGPVYAGGSVNAQSGGDLSVRQSVAAATAITLNAAGQLTNGGIVEAGVNPDNSRNATGDVSLQGAGIANRGSVIASRSLTVTTAGTLDNTGATLSAGNRAQINATTLNNTQGRVQSRGGLGVQAGTLTNAQGIVTSTGALEATLRQTTNGNGEISSQDRLTLRGQSLDNRQGKLIGTSGLDLTVTGNLDNRGGNLVSHGDLQARIAGDLDNRQQGNLYGAGATVLSFDRLLNAQGVLASDAVLSLMGNQVNNDGGQLGSLGNLTATLGSLDQLDGQLISQGQLTLIADRLGNTGNGLVAGKTGLELQVGMVDNRGGELSSQSGTANLTGQSLFNGGGKVIAGKGLTMNLATADNSAKGVLKAGENLQATLTAALNNSSGQLLASGGLVLGSASLNNLGGLISGQGAVAVTTGALDNTQGQLLGQATLDLTATSLDNRQGVLSSVGQQTLTVTGGAVQNDGGQVVTDSGLTLTSASLANAGGTLSAKGAMTLVTGDLDNSQVGSLVSGDRLAVSAQRLDNASGRISSGQDLQLTLGGALDNAQGRIVGQGKLDLTTTDLDNRQGLVSSAGQQTLTVTGGAVQNDGGQVVTDSGLTLNSASLANGTGTLSAMGAAILTTTGALTNAQGGRLVGSDTFTVTAGSLTNAGRLASAKDLVVTTASLINSNELFSQAGLTLDLKSGTLTNASGGLITAPGTLLLKNLNTVRNAGEISSGQAFTLAATSLDNSGGRLISNASLTLRIARALANAKGSLSAAGLDVEAASLDNSAGVFTSSQNLSVTLTGARADGQGLLLNDQGELLSEGTLTLTAADLDNRQGLVSSAGQQTLTVTGGAVQNDGGQVVTDSGLTLTSASLDNGSGALSAKGAVSLSTTGALTNAQDGRLIGSDTFTVTAGSLSNAGRLASAKDLAITTASLTNSSELFSQAGLTLDLKNGALTNTRGGLITAPGALLLKNLNTVRNAGEISSGQAFTLAATSLDNSDGKLISNAGLTLRIARALTNAKGALSAAGLDLEAARLDNSAGLLTSRQGLRVTLTGARSDGQGLLLNDQGQLLSDGTLDLTAADLDNRQGLVSSAGQQTLTVTGGTVQNGGGQLVADGGLILSSASLANAAGTLSAKGAVTLTTGVLDNGQQGRLVGGDTVTVTAQRLDNSSGLVSSAKALHLTLTGALTNAGGQLLSEDTLGLEAGSLDNRQGVISSAGQQTVTVTGGTVQNGGGQLVADGGLTLSSASLDNGTGTLSAKGAVTLTTTGALNNAQQGALVGSDSLTVTAGSLNNAGRLASTQALAVTTASLTNSGELFSQAGVTLDLQNGTLTNASGGLITAPGALLLKNLNTVRNAGELSSSQAFTLAADSLDNSGGKLISNADLTLRIARALTNAKGTLSAAGLDLRAASLANMGGTLASRGALSVTTTGLLDNSADGLLSAATTLDVTADTLSNAGGSLLAKGAATITAGQLDNTTKGLINSQASLTVTADRLDSSSEGEVSAKGDVQLTLGEFKQQGGRLIGEAAVGLDLGRAGGTGNLDNTGGLITTTGVLSFAHLNQVDNTGGEIGSSQGFNLIAQGLNNTRGKLISQGLLSIQASQLTNDGGLLSGWQGLNVTGGNLSNRQSGTLSSKVGDLTATLTGALDNGDNGALVSQGVLKVTAASLTNTGGVLSSGAAQILTVTDTLQNGPQGLIDAGTTLSVSAGQFANTGGTAQAQGALTASGGSLDNSNGTLNGQQAVTLDLVGALTNTSGAVLAKGDLLVKNATAVSNAQGRLNSGSLLTLLVGGLDNSSGGTVAAQGNLLLTTGGQVLNGGDGLLASQGGALNVTAGSLDNANGTLQSAGDLTLATGTGDIGNVGGKVIAQNGDLHITGANLDSRGGTLASLQGAFIAGINGLLKNGGQGQSGGTIQAQRLDLTAATLDNYNGKVSALGGNALLQTGRVDNRNGSLYGKGLVQVRGGSFDNSGDNDGKVFGSQIDFGLSGALNNRLGIIESSSTLSLAAASLDNTNGQLRALGTSGTTLLRLDGTLDNTNGRLETANQDLQLAIGGLTNTNGTLLHVGAGTFGLGLPLLQNAGGSVTSNGTLTLNGSSWTNSSTLQVANLAVNIDNLTQTGSGQLLAGNSFTGTGSNWTNDGLIAAGGNLSLTLGGTYQGAGRLSSGNDFTLGAGQVLLDNPNARLTAGSGTTTFNMGGLLRNQARITSVGNFILNAGQVDNQGTLGASGNLTINTPTLTNQNSSLIFSGGSMSLNVNDFTNHAADIYSLGNLTIGGNGTTRTGNLRNISGTLEGNGSVLLFAENLENRTEGYALGRTLVSGAIFVQCFDCSGDHYDVSYWTKETYQSSDNDTSAAASISAGRDFLFQGGNFLNSKSAISAGNQISISATSFTNQGAQSGTIERTRVYRTGRVTDGTVKRFVDGAVVPYNQVNNPQFPNIYYVDSNENWRLGIPESYRYRDGGGRDAEWVQSVRLRDSETNTVVSGTLTGYAYQNIPTSNYDKNNLRPLPAGLQEYSLVKDIEVVTGGGTTRSAIIQAGGAVSINASQNLENSVIRQDYAVATGANRVQSTQVSSVGAPTVVRLNTQLPPDLAQQEVNPTTLPGFSLPTGQNGLFRLSSQQGREGELKPLIQEAGVRSTQVAPVDKATIQVAKYNAGRSEDTIRQLLSAQTGNVSTLQVEKAADTSFSNKAQLDGVAFTKPAILAPLPAQIAGAAGSNGQAGLESGTDMRSPVAVIGKMRDSLTDGGLHDIVAAKGLVQSEALTPIPYTVGSNLSHRYLVETNPALTDLKQFMSSDYLLGNLNYNPDTSWKRLGDGLYEQRLIQQAIVQRTGQRFIAGLNSDEAQFKYLMDNALSSKQALGLSVGVSLTAEQVAALTHDIVWMEDQVINGEHVLVPVLYLANANNRLAPNGALIQGSDVTLIAGNELTNAGTLRATNNLTATATNNLVNSGLIQSGDRLSLTSTLGDITNRAGGIIAGRDVELTASKGDILNERTVTIDQRSAGGSAYRNDYADSAARIEASNNLSLTAGRDISNVGSVLSAGGNATLIAGRDVNLVSAQTQTGRSSGANNTSSSITQLGGSLTAGRDLGIGAGRDLTAVASTLSAGGNASLAAQENLTLAAAADETHSYSKSKKVTRQEDHVDQQITTITAGGNVNLVAKQGDLTLVASKVEAANEAYLYAGKDLNVLAAEDSDYSLYDMKKKGSFGAKKTKRDEVTDVRNIGSEIKAGGDITLQSEGSQTYQAAKLESGKDLTLDSGGDITFEAVKDLHQESHEKSSNSLAWTSMKGKGNTDETLKQSELVAQGQLAIQAANKIHIDVKDINAQSVSQTVDAMVKADPNLAWIKQAEAQGDIDWRQVKEIHDSFKYSHSGLGAGAQLVLAIALAALTGGAGAALVGAAQGSITAAVANAVVLGMENTAANSFISNRGNLGATFKDTFSSSSLQNYAVSGLTAGFTTGYLDKAFGVTGDNAFKVTRGFDLTDIGGIGKFAAYSAAQGTFQAAAQTAIQGGSFGENLSGALSSQAQGLVQAVAFNAVGTYTDGKYLDGSVEKIAMHALVGGLLSAAEGKGFATGAAAAGANEALINQLSSLVNGDPKLLLAASQIVGVLAAASVNGDVQTGANIAKDATAYNRIPHEQQKRWFADAAKGDATQEARLSAAACAVLKCSAGYPEGSAEYNTYKAIEDLGNSPAYADARQTVQASGLFDYGGLDSVRDAVGRYQVAERLGGVVQIGGGAATAFAGGFITYATGGAGFVIGVPLLVVGADNAAAGATTAMYGNQAYTFGAQGLSSALGISPGSAEMLYGLASAAGEATAVNQVLGGLRLGFAGEVTTVPSIEQRQSPGVNSWDNVSFRSDGDFGYLPPVRQLYVRDVFDLKESVDTLRAGGASEEEIAKYAYNARNELKIKYRQYTPPDELERIDLRNVERYGDKIGPSFDYLLGKGKSFEQIIESSTRAGGGDLY